MLKSCEAMGTRFEALLIGDDAQHLDAVAVAVIEEIVRLGGVLSRFDPRSEIARVNREAVHAPARVDREVFGLLEKCEEARRLTAGYFDVTASLGAAARAPALRLDAEICAAQFTGPDVVIDLGGVGKGYALDRGREIMLRFGVTCGLLHGGASSVLAVGALPGKGGWLVAVRHPLTPDAAPVAQLELVDQGLSCSAVRRPGQRQSDVLNPLTGRPLDGDAACVTLAANATNAEIFSTALLAMGREEAKRYLERAPHHGLAAGWFEPGDGFTWI
ncbi:MAG TPA: FAD:protein FMN transferase [Blastocatellia bacterium]|nr:FAD:protein FMN transferase [Blastocatellia bacterium]